MADSTKQEPEEKQERPKGLAQAIREAKGLVTAIMLALAGFAWNKIESCMDRDFNRNVQKSGYDLLQGQINEMRHEINECVIGLEVWKRTNGIETGKEEAKEDKPVPASGAFATTAPRKGKGKRMAGRRPASVEEDRVADEAAEMVSGVAEEVAAEMSEETPPPSFDDIVQHVKKKSTPLNMQNWEQEIQQAAPPRVQTQEQFQDEDSQ
jgi:hypothetical protein